MYVHMGNCCLMPALGHCSMFLELIGRTDTKDEAHDNRDMMSGWHHSEKVKLLPAEIFCGWHENIPSGFCPFLLTEPSVAITWEFLFRLFSYDLWCKFKKL